MNKIDRARALLRKAESAGHVATVEGHWVVFRPPLPLNLLMEASELGDALTAAIDLKAAHDRAAGGED